MFPAHKKEIVVLAWVGLLAILVARIGLTYREFNATVDEGRHIAASIELYQTGEFSIYYWSPPLPRYAIGLLPYWSGIRLPDQKDDDSRLGKYVLAEAGEYWRTLTLARMGILLFVPFLMFYVYRWSALLYGRKAGLAACLLITFSPNIIAHSSLATVDLAATATLFAATFHLWRWSVAPGLAACLLSAVTFSMACLSKFPAAGFLALIFLTYFLIARRKSLANAGCWKLHSAGTALGRGAVFCAAVFFLVWTAYQFRLDTLATRFDTPMPTVDRWVTAGSPVNVSLHRIVATTPVPMPAFVHGLKAVWDQSQGGFPAFFLGAKSDAGWWYYFPVAIGLKTTLPFLMLILLAAALLVIVRGKSPMEGSIYLAAGAIIVLAVSMHSKVNIGIRHVLAIYPFFAVLASGVFASRWLAARKYRWTTALGAVLLLWHTGESVQAHPDYLAYFNPIARGNEPYFLADSNLDWGQDLARLSRYLQTHKIEEVTLSIFGSTAPAVLGLANAKPFRPGERPRGWFAVSVSHLQGIGIEEADFRWLEAYSPTARIGKTILLYHLPE